MHGSRRCCRDTPWIPTTLRNRAALAGPGLACLRCAPALRSPCVACVPARAIRGSGVRRDNSPLDYCLFPAHPAALGRPGQSIPALPVRRANPFGCALPASLGRSPGPASTGRSPDSGSPRGALENLRLTRGEPGRPGKVSLALFLHRPHPCRLGASIPACNGLRNKRSSCTGLWSELMGQCLPWFFQFTKQKARFLLCSTRPLTLRRSPVTQQPVL